MRAMSEWGKDLQLLKKCSKKMIISMTSKMRRLTFEPARDGTN